MLSEFNEVMFSSYHAYLKILHQNIRSLRKNFDLFLLKIQSLESLPVVILLTEIWIDKCETTLYQIPEYTMYAKCSSHRAGGVALYVTNHIISRETDALNIV